MTKAKCFVASLGVAVAWSGTLGGLVQPQARGGGQATIDYQQQVHPIIAAKCLTCHSAERRSGGLSLASYGDALQGGRSGAAIRPGDPEDSLLMRRMTGRVTPVMPLGQPALSPDEIAV